MKYLCQCEYCTKQGVDTEIEEHEKTCAMNPNQKNCLTCEHQIGGALRVKCNKNIEVPNDKMMTNCKSWEQTEKKMFTDVSNLFGDLFGFGR
jgi:hypothetical protein